MDKRKEVALEKIKQSASNFLQDRRRILDLLREVESREKFLELTIQQNNNYKQQVLSGNIKAKNKYGDVLSKEELQREIEASEDSEKTARLQINYMKEDLFFKLPKENTDTLFKEINEHFKKVTEAYDLLKKKIGDLNAV